MSFTQEFCWNIRFGQIVQIRGFWRRKWIRIYHLQGPQNSVHSRKSSQSRCLLNSRSSTRKNPHKNRCRTNNMSTIQRICIFLSLFLATPPPFLATADGGRTTPLTAYDILQSYDFPVGILPEGVTHYEINRATGKFSAYFDGSCSFSLEGSYQLKYKSKISGYISKDKLTKLSGVSVKVLFLWLNIDEVKRNGDKLDFSVGILSAEFGINNFYESPRCGCGFNCKSISENRQRGGIRSNPFVSSI